MVKFFQSNEGLMRHFCSFLPGLSSASLEITDTDAGAPLTGIMLCLSFLVVVFYQVLVGRNLSEHNILV